MVSREGRPSVHHWGASTSQHTPPRTAADLGRGLAPALPVILPTASPPPRGTLQWPLSRPGPRARLQRDGALGHCWPGEEAALTGAQGGPGPHLAEAQPWPPRAPGSKPSSGGPSTESPVKRTRMPVTSQVPGSRSSGAGGFSHKCPQAEGWGVAKLPGPCL